MIKSLVGDRILIAKQEIPDGEEAKTASGIVIPNKTSKVIYWEAEVLKVGSSVKEDIHEGDTIVYSVGTTTDIIIDDEEYQFLPSGGIIAVK